MCLVVCPCVRIRMCMCALCVVVCLRVQLIVHVRDGLYVGVFVLMCAGACECNLLFVRSVVCMFVCVRLRAFA